MLTPRRSFALAVILSLFAGSAQAGQSWQGVQIMPSSAQVSIQAEDGSAVSMYDICWPATVQRTKGRFLWVQDDGGYSRNQVGGWIYCDDAVKVDDARDHYTSALRRGETAWLYWMRGISWESKGEPGVALVDYKNAMRVDPNTTIDDIEIRLGRIFAAEQLLNGRGMYGKGIPNAWEKHFENANRINPNRPQLHYEWGFALSQACDCSITKRQKAADEKAQSEKVLADAKAAADKTTAERAMADAIAKERALAATAPAKRGAGSAADKTHPKYATRGPDPAADESPATSKPKPANAAAPTATAAATDPKSASDTAAVTPSVPPAVLLDLATVEPITIVSRAGPDEAGAGAAVQALDQYVTAEGLSPNWWRIPLARAELMLDQCDEESPTGERVAISPVDTTFFGQLLSHGQQDPAHALLASQTSRTPLVSDVAAQPSPQSVALRGEEVSSNGSVKSPTSKARELSPAAQQVLIIAIDDFNKAISLNSNALDAYRDRAEVLRIVNRPAEAEESATTACNLCYYRQARSLRTLAQISKANKHYDRAADYALRAAELTSAEEQQRFLRLWYTYSTLAKGDAAKVAIAAASEQAGNVSSRGGEDETPKAPPAHIEPPPGFLSRPGN